MKNIFKNTAKHSKISQIEKIRNKIKIIEADLTESDTVDRGIAEQYYFETKKTNKRVKNILEYIEDNVISLINIFSKKKNNTFCFNYYKNLYQEKSPDPQKFLRIIKRKENLFQENPYNISNEEYYCYHPDFLMGYDLEVIMSEIMDEVEQNRSKDKTTNKRKAYTQKDIELAKICFGIYLAKSNNKKTITNYVHIDNLSMLTGHVIKSFPDNFLGITKDMVIEGAKKKNIFPVILFDFFKKAC